MIDHDTLRKWIAIEMKYVRQRQALMSRLFAALYGPAGKLCSGPIMAEVK